jgi:multidrug efflux pump subunit AcrA (membrane-fusion protein)
MDNIKSLLNRLLDFESTWKAGLPIYNVAFAREAADALEAANARIAALEVERDGFRKQADLYQHMVITCGVAARHSDANLSKTGAYAGKWNSQQANEVRALRDDRDALRDQLTAKTELATLSAASLRKVEDELASTNRMFVEACSALGLVDEALGIDPDESGGAAPILEAIAELKAQIAAADAQGPAGVVGYMPGAAGFTMATFLTTDAPPGTKVFTTPQPTPSAIEAWSALIANSLLGQQKKEDVEEVGRLIRELLGVKT